MILFVRKYTMVFILMLLTSCSTKAQPEKIENYINNLIQQQKLAGAAIAVLKDDKLLFDKNYGFADVENKLPVTDSTLFSLMSVTKNFIAFAVMQLADKNLVSLDAPVSKYLKSLPSQYDSLQVYQLLNHSSGVPDYVHVKGYMEQANQTQTPMQILKPILNQPLDFKSGTKSAYSNSNYFLLGLIIEKVTGKPLGTYLKENIFQPVEMNNTYLEDNTLSSALKAKGYTNITGELKYQAPLNPSQYWAAGGIVSTKNDLINFDKAVMDGNVLPKNEIKQMMQPIKFDDGTMSDYGLGFELMNNAEMKIAGNNGAGVGYNASNLIFLNDGITIIVLTNTTNGNSSSIAKNIRDIIMNAADNNTSTNQQQRKNDKLDSLVIHVFNDAQSPIINAMYFNDTASFDKFKKETVAYIQAQGKLLNVLMQGEKINTQSIVRRYEVEFEKGKTNWVIIFSADGKIILTNRM